MYDFFMGTRFALFVAVAAVSSLSLMGCKEDPEFLDPVGDDAAPIADEGVTPPVCGESTLEYLEECANASECGSCVCEQAGHLNVCTKTCIVDADCPAPSRGCSGGFCRP